MNNLPQDFLDHVLLNNQLSLSEKGFLLLLLFIPEELAHKRGMMRATRDSDMRFSNLIPTLETKGYIKREVSNLPTAKRLHITFKHANYAGDIIPAHQPSTNLVQGCDEKA